MFDLAPNSPTRKINLLLLPGSSLAELGLALACFDLANRLSESVLYEVRLLSADGTPPLLAEAAPLAVAGRFEPTQGCDLLLLFAGEAAAQALTVGEPLVAALQQCQRQCGAIAAAGFASYWLAQAGLLNGYRATVHWRALDHFSERYPHVICSSNLLEVDRDRLSCGGGSAVADLVLGLIGRQHGSELAAAIAEQLLLERVRSKDDRQRIPLHNQIGANQPKLVQAVMLMEANLEEPLTTDEIAGHVGVSRRQLERLFKQHLESVPSQYYLELRLNRARQQLRQTSKSIIQIGLSCGFSSGPHFSSAYRNHFGSTPREERSPRKPTGGEITA